MKGYKAFNGEVRKMNELKPCPFCGGTLMQWSAVKYANPLFKQISCRRCGAAIMADLRTTDEGTEIALQDALIERWNTRVK